MPYIKPRNNPCIEVVDEQMAVVLREKTEAERLALAHGMWRSTHEMITHIVRNRHPEWSQQQIQAETSRRLAYGAV